MKNSMLLSSNTAVNGAAPFSEPMVPWVLTFTAIALALVILVLAMLVLKVAIEKAQIRGEISNKRRKNGPQSTKTMLIQYLISISLKELKYS